MTDMKIRYKEKPEASEVVAGDGIPFQGSDNKDYWIDGLKIVQKKDIKDSLTSSLPTKALSANQGKIVKALIDWQNRADGLLFKFQAIWTIARDGGSLDITIPAGSVVDINSKTLINFTQGSLNTIQDGGGITATITGGAITFDFEADISTIAEGSDLDVFVVAKNLNGKLVSRIPSIENTLYPTTTVVQDLSWKFDVSVVMADPGSGDFRMDNATPASVTELSFAKISNQGIDVSDVLTSITPGTEIQIIQATDQAKYIIGTAGVVVDGSGFVRVPITITDSGNIFDGSAECSTSLYYEQPESVSDITRSYVETAVSASQISIDFGGKQEAWVTKSGGGGVVVNENIAVVLANDTEGKTANLFIEVQTTAREITLDAEVSSNDSRWDNGTDKLTLPVGNYLLRFQFVNGVKYLEVLPEVYGSGSDVIEIGFAASDEDSDLETDTAKLTFRMPFAMVLTEVRANVKTAPTGSTLICDINENGTTILSTKLSIDAGEKTSTTAAIPPVISDANLADDSEITVDTDQIGATIAGTGLKLYLIGTRV